MLTLQGHPSNPQRIANKITKPLRYDQIITHKEDPHPHPRALHPSRLSAATLATARPKGREAKDGTRRARDSNRANEEE